jgi:tetratricopeptide (TPR) repeat protein
MKTWYRVVLSLLVMLGICFGCVSVNPQVKDAEAAMNNAKKLMSEGNTEEAVPELLRARDLFIEADYTYSAYETYSLIAQAYYLTGDTSAAIDTYFSAIEYAMENPWAVSLKDVADQMRQLSALLRVEGRMKEAEYLLEDALLLYQQIEDEEGIDAVREEMDLLDQ